jgi:hypothetical protein
MHWVAAAFAKVPREQAVHDLAFIVLLTEPAAQAMHCLVFLVLYEPGVQAGVGAEVG